jgi:predicted O-methyltransferase YrrM
MHQYLQLITQKPTAWLGHGAFAVNLVALLKPKMTVDLGVDFGYSTFCFAYPQIGKVVGIDCFEGDIHAGQRSTYDHVIKLRDHFKKYWNQTNVRFVKGYFEDVAQSWEKPIDILHIDGLHTYEAVKQDFTTWSKFLQPNGVILMHDTVSFPNDVGRFFKELPDYKFNFQHTHGLGVWTASAETFERIRPLLIEQ